MTIPSKELQSIAKAIQVYKAGRKRYWKDNYFWWVKDNWTSRGEPLDFKKHKYLEQIYQDQHPFLVDMKSAQVGLTERLITEAIWLADQYKENSIYFMPTTSMVSDLVQERVDEPINNSEYLREVSGRSKRIMGKQADKVGMKRMSKGFVYFRGSNRPSQIITVSGDVMFADEVDQMMAESIPYFDKRLEHSNRKWQRWGSTPTVPDFGIHKIFLKSDQHKYQIKCSHCNEWQELTFWDNIDQEKKQLVCRKCRQEIIPWECECEWVKTQESDIRGYHISQLYSPRLDIAKLIKESNKTAEWEVQQFYNQNLGLPYEASGAKISEADIEACKRDYIMPIKDDDAFMGIDVGRVLHIVIISKKRLLFVGTRKNFEEVDGLINDYNCKGIVIDALPETRKAQELANRFMGRIHLCYYSGMKEVKEGQWYKTDIDKVNTDRTLSLDMAFNVVKKQAIEFPKNIADFSDFKTQLKSLTRVVKEDRGNQKAEYLQTGEDHYAHSFNYANIAKNIYGNITMPEVFII